MDMTPGQIFALVAGGILALAGFINTVGAAIEKIGKAIDAAKAPGEEQNKQIQELQDWRTEWEDWRKDVDRKLGSDQSALRAVHDGNQAIFQALIALLDHGIDGNNLKQMEDAKADIIKNLIKK